MQKSVKAPKIAKSRTVLSKPKKKTILPKVDPSKMAKFHLGVDKNEK